MKHALGNFPEGNCRGEFFKGRILLGEYSAVKSIFLESLAWGIFWGGGAYVGPTKGITSKQPLPIVTKIQKKTQENTKKWNFWNKMCIKRMYILRWY